MRPVWYNGNYRAAQGRDSVAVEMIHDARVVPLYSQHHSNDVKNCMGDSVGW
ncbi:hypothetical protein [Aurantivibrio plasticivorans]